MTVPDTLPDGSTAPVVPDELAEDAFWALLDLVGDLRGPDDPYRDLVAALAALPVEAVAAFDQALARALHQLDRRDLADVVVSWQRVTYLCDDLFLHLRCGIVAAGRAAHRAVLADPEAARPLLHWEQQDEGLLAVADAAHLAVTGRPRLRPVYRYEYESRSNTAGWARGGAPPGP